MAKRKTTKLSTVSSGESVIDAPDEGQTTMILDQPTGKDVHAGEEVVVAVSPSTSPGTSAASDARKMSRLKPYESITSPYACDPVAIKVGPGFATYWVPKHLLSSPKWSTIDAGGTVCLPGVSAATGHTLVHYLYTGTYQALGAKGEDSTLPALIKFKEAFLTFVLASNYALQDLERLAKEQIEIHGSHMTLIEVLETVDNEFSETDQTWFHEYLHARVEEQFDLDYTFFTTGAFVESVGRGTLYRFMTCHVLDIFSVKLTRALQGRESRCHNKEKPDAVLDKVGDAAVQRHYCYRCHGGHQACMCTASDKMSFEFANASCGDVDGVISLQSSSNSDCAASASQIEEVSYTEMSDVNEDRVMVTSGLTQVNEELYEPTPAIDVEQQKSDFDSHAFKDATEAASPAEEKLVEDAGWDFSAGFSRITKKGKMSTLIEETAPEHEPTPAPELQEKEDDDPWSFTFGNATKDKNKKRKDAVEERSQSEHEPTTELKPVPERECGEEEDPWALAVFAIGKKVEEEPMIEEPPPPADPEPESKLAPLEPEPESLKEEPASDPFAGLTRTQKKKLELKMKRKARAREEEAAELARQAEEAEAERIHLEEEEAAAAAAATAEAERKVDDGWDYWGSATTTTSKKKKEGKGVVAEEVILVPEEPKSTTGPGLESAARQEAFFEPEQIHKSKPETMTEEFMPNSPRAICPRQLYHLLEGDRWRSCEQCCAMLKAMAVQLAKKNKAVLL